MDYVNEFNNIRYLATCGSGRKDLGIPASKKDMAFVNLVRSAYNAGHAAATAATPVPMVVQQHASVLDDSSPVVQQWHVPEGVCGFAWVRFKGNTSFGRWAKKYGLADPDSYAGGLMVWVSDYNQSMTRKEAFARAFARYLNENGIPDAHAESRLD